MADAVEVAPEMQFMAEEKMAEVLAPHNALLVKQTMRGCFQECLGCSARSEYKVAPFNPSEISGVSVTQQALEEPNILYALEDSGCCCRLFNPGGRGFTMRVSKGDAEGGEPILNFIKPLTCPAFCQFPTQDGSACPCCCCLPQMTPILPNGQPLQSQSYYHCDYKICVPKFMYHEKGQPLYLVKPETCWGGWCVSCSCTSCKGLAYTPFYFHDPQTGELLMGKYEDPTSPQIRKVWAGFKKECCSTADTFTVIFPPDSDPLRKAGLLGMTFLIDFVYFEYHQAQEHGS